MRALLQMKNNPRLMAGVLAGVIVVGGLGVFAVKRVFLKPQPTLFLTEGFNFNLLRSRDIEWRGPEIGYKLDLTRLEDRNGKTLASILGNGPAMLVSVNSQCGMCTIATDQMLNVRSELSSKGLNYYVLFFVSQAPESDFQYADSLNLGTQTFVWNAKLGPPSEDVFKMAAPSHLLINGDGTVIRVWPGSYDDKSVRDRMAQQILADTSVIIDTLNVVHSEEVSVRK